MKGTPVQTTCLSFYDLFMNKILFFAVLLLSVLGFASCSETDNDTTAEKYDNWETRNTTAWADSLTQARKAVASGDTAHFRVYKRWALENLTPTSSSYTPTVTDNDYIAVRILHTGKSKYPCSESTDSVRVHYAGYLINGDSFDSSWNAENSSSVPDYTTARPTTFLTSGLVDGFTTALLHMHNGDEWLVTMPAKMAYKTSAQGTYGATSYIPANSTLVFRIKLDSYFRK